jgi:hypothetical protein
MPYISVENDGHRDEYKIDMRKFAKDLATALGGDAVAEPSTKDYPDANQDIILASHKIRLGLVGQSYARTANKATINVYASAIGIPHNDHNHYDNTHKTTSITISPDKRDIFAIARDIVKRVIDANLPALAKQREYATMKADNRLSLKTAIGELTTTIPGIKVKATDDGDAASFSYYNRNTGGRVSIDGRISPKGKITIDRISDCNMIGLANIIAELNENGVD